MAATHQPIKKVNASHKEFKAVCADWNVNTFVHHRQERAECLCFITFTHVFLPENDH